MPGRYGSSSQESLNGPQNEALQTMSQDPTPNDETQAEETTPLEQSPTHRRGSYSGHYKRNARIVVYLNPEEKKKVEDLAGKLGLDASSYLRMLALKDKRRR